MAQFAWDAKTRTGEDIKGVTEADNKDQVIAMLKNKALIPGSIKEKGKGLDMNIKFFAPKVTSRDIVIFTRQFATMIDAGLPLVQCLEILSGEAENPTFKDILKAVKEDVESGATFADALGKHPKAFDTLYVNLVAAGEVGGILDTILNRLCEYIEKNEAIIQKIKSAMTYPIVVLTIAMAVVTVLLIKVIPTFADMFADMGSSLPPFTQFLVDVSGWVTRWWWAVIIGFFATSAAYKFIRGTEKGLIITDDIYLRIPVFGNLLRKSAIARFTRTLGTMVSSGVPILDALDITGRTAGNKVVELEIYKVRTAISEGKTIAEPLQGSKVFPSMVVQMISVGEQAGALDTMLNKIADFYEQEVDIAVDGLTAMMEPLLITFLGVVVGGIMIGMYLPIFQLGNVI